jgi:acyl-CoA thioesterase
MRNGDDKETFEAWSDAQVFAQAFGLVCRSASWGETVMELSTSPLMLNPNGAVHGGIIAAVIDNAMGATALTVLPAGGAAVTTTLNISYLAPAMLPLEFRTRVVRKASRVLFMEVAVLSAGTVVDAATGTMVPIADYASEFTDTGDRLPPAHLVPLPTSRVG